MGGKIWLNHRSSCHLHRNDANSCPNLCANVEGFVLYHYLLAPRMYTVLFSGETHLVDFDDFYNKAHLDKMRSKLGIKESDEKSDLDFVDTFLKAMQRSGADFTNTFRVLSLLRTPAETNFGDSLELVKSRILDMCTNADELRKQYKPNISERELEMVQMLANTNPQLLSMMGGRRLLGELRKMEIYDDYKDLTDVDKRVKDEQIWTEWLQKYTDRLNCDYPVGTASSVLKERVSKMDASNPNFILRNHLLQSAIEKAESGDYSEVKRLFELSKKPYDESHVLTLQSEAVTTSSSSDAAILEKYFSRPALKDLDIRVT